MRQPVKGISHLIVLEGALDGLPHPRAGGQAAAVGGFPKAAVERLWHKDLKSLTHMLILL